MNQIATGRLNHNRIHWMFSPVQFITLHKLKKKKKDGISWRINTVQKSIIDTSFLTGLSQRLQR